ncbi:MAG: peptidylprolyl isomerase, partial [Rhodothermia bacterium]
TERELGAFYTRTRQDYKREKTLDIEYVRFSKLATRSDTSLVLSELEAFRDDFAAAESDSVFLARNGSEKGYISSYFRVDELDPEIGDLVFDNLDSDGALGPVIVRNQAHLIKIGDVRDAEDVAVKARHILVSAREGESPEIRSEARKKAADLKARIMKGEDFADLARQFSDDPGSGALGGDLGWFGPGKMVEPFEKAAVAAKVGDVIGPVESQFGYHIIEVLDRADKEIQISDFVMTLRPSIDTIGEAQDAAADLAYYAEESGDFAGEVAKHGDHSMETVAVQSDMDVVPGLGASRDVKGFISTAKKGDISEVIELNDDFVILHVAKLTQAGYRSFEDVRAELEPKARLERKIAIQAQRLRDALTKDMDLEDLAESVGGIRRVASAVKQNNTLVPTLGRDPIFVGVALGLEREILSPVIEGTTAAYVMRVTSAHQADLGMLTSVGRDNLRREIENRKKQTVTGRWLAELRETADIADYRYRF